MFYKLINDAFFLKGQSGCHIVLSIKAGFLYTKGEATYGLLESFAQE